MSGEGTGRTVEKEGVFLPVRGQLLAGSGARSVIHLGFTNTGAGTREALSETLLRE